MAVPPAGTVAVWPLPTVTTLTAVFDPSAVSVTVHTVPAGMFEYVWSMVPATEPAGITKSVSVVPPQTTWMVTAAWLPAAVPLIVLRTTRLPGRNV